MGPQTGLLVPRLQLKDFSSHLILNMQSVNDVTWKGHSGWLHLFHLFFSFTPFKHSLGTYSDASTVQAPSLGPKRKMKTRLFSQVHIVSTASRLCILKSIREVPRPFCELVVFDASGDCNKLPGTSGLEQQKSTFSPYQEIKVWNQNISRVHSFCRLWSETVPQSSSRFYGSGL